MTEAITYVKPARGYLALRPFELVKREIIVLGPKAEGIAEEVVAVFDAYTNEDGEVVEPLYKVGDVVITGRHAERLSQLVIPPRGQETKLPDGSNSPVLLVPEDTIIGLLDRDAYVGTGYADMRRPEPVHAGAN